MGVLGTKRKDGAVVLSKESVKEWMRGHGVDVRPPVRSDAFVAVDDVAVTSE